MHNSNNSTAKNSINVVFLPSNVMLGVNVWQFNTEQDKHIWGIDLGLVFLSITFSRMK